MNYCDHCKNRYSSNYLKQDIFNTNNLLCLDCYNMRECNICKRDYPIYHLFEYDYVSNLICKNCYKFDIYYCFRCNKTYHSKNMVLQGNNTILCDRCNHYFYIEKELQLSEKYKIEKN